MKPLVAAVILAAALAGAAFVPVAGGEVAPASTDDSKRVREMDLSGFSAEPPQKRLRLLFIHHSIGGQLLAPAGTEAGAHCIYDAHPSGGDLRSRLGASGYDVHEASYDSEVGHDTDLFHWLPKFRTKMDRVLRVDQQNQQLPEGQTNNVVMFKSCYPNSQFVGEGTAPGNPNGPELTLWNAKATMNAVRDELAKHPDVLFVYFTAPPLAPKLPSQPAWKWAAKKILGRGFDANALRRSGAFAREFNNWMKSPDGWLHGYPHQNIVVFDYYDVLTRDGATDLLAYPTRGGLDAHPAAEGNRRAAERFVPFLNRAVRRAGLSD